ncbi:hypothetical protein E2C01_066101 [Portunus trituberculatus]|uniref:Uncharacterized protein n=1 Tax=Portunus trituberculatus TaxID=210409 RepID=A0A5B7HG90_PORTR|nr:hypothetical protein [Portunus trituberculatus]
MPVSAEKNTDKLVKSNAALVFRALITVAFSKQRSVCIVTLILLYWSVVFRCCGVAGVVLGVWVL